MAIDVRIKKLRDTTKIQQLKYPCQEGGEKMEDKYVAAMRKYHEKECSPVFFRHFDRCNENYSNTDIDPDRTEDNYNLAPDHGMDTYTYYRQEYRRLEKEGALIRPDLVTCAGVLKREKNWIPALGIIGLVMHR